MLRGNAQHSGFLKAELKEPLRLIWALEFPGERIGTAVEPIVSRDQLFVATHQGSLYALRGDTGQPQWKFQAHGAFLHSPAVCEGIVVAASAAGEVFGIKAENGELAWQLPGSDGGFSAAPIFSDGHLYIGARSGDFLAVDANKGVELWRQSLGVPIRQTAAHAGDKVFVTAEDLRVRCFDAASGKLLWTSEPLAGQTARDYYPIVVRRGEKSYVVVRTNPLLNMGQRISADRSMLCRNAGVDDGGWQKVDAWTKSEAARGNPELWQKEQNAIITYLETNRAAQSFFVLDVETGQQAMIPPVLWIAGCQAVGAQPALTADGRLLVFYRSAYGNWNHGVAPLVALGLFDFGKNQITPLFHQQGKQPRWNCFWGTADESQNFITLGKTVLIVHQGTLSRFNLQTSELAPIHGERDTYGGFRNPPWARNEWHGPGRGGVAASHGRLYWQTGSRVLCLAPDPVTAAVKPTVIQTNGLPTTTAPVRPGPTRAELKKRLTAAVEEVISQRWAPLFVDPGLAGRDFSFDNSAEIIEALAWAYPHLDADSQKTVLPWLKEEWVLHPPLEAGGNYSLSEGAPREWFAVPREYRTRLGKDKRPHPFGNAHILWRFAERCDQHEFVKSQWPSIQQSFESFLKTNWKLDSSKPDVYANRYLASLIATAELANWAGHNALAQRAEAKAEETTTALLGWWRRAAEQGSLRTFKSSSELDPFIGKGDAFSLAVAPHRHKLALFRDLTPEIAERILSEGGARSADTVWATVEELYCTWSLMGEERQVHFGENFVDPPDLALGAFRAMKWLRKSSRDELARRVDIPFCRADLAFVTKLAIALE